MFLIKACTQNYDNLLSRAEGNALGFRKTRVILSPVSSLKELEGLQDPSRSCSAQSSAEVKGTVTLANPGLSLFNGADPGEIRVCLRCRGRWGLSPLT